MKEKCKDCKEWNPPLFDPDSLIPKRIQESRCTKRNTDRKGTERACGDFKPRANYKPWKPKRRDWSVVKQPHGTKEDAVYTKGAHQ